MECNSCLYNDVCGYNDPCAYYYNGSDLLEIAKWIVEDKDQFLKEWNTYSREYD